MGMAIYDPDALWTFLQYVVRSNGLLDLYRKGYVLVDDNKCYRRGLCMTPSSLLSSIRLNLSSRCTRCTYLRVNFKFVIGAKLSLRIYFWCPPRFVIANDLSDDSCQEILDGVRLS